MDLNTLIFEDLYVSTCLTRVYMTSRLAGPAVGYPPEEVIHELKGVVAKLKDMSTSMGNVSEFRYVHSSNDSTVNYRVSRITSAGGEVWVLRKNLSRTIALDKLNLPPYHVSALERQGEGKGLVIVAGGPNMGKTTTAASLFARWIEKGGVGITLEDPPEIPIDGPHGNGVCFQIPVERGAWAESLAKSLRFGSRYLFMGETRDGDAAREMARAALSNQTVLNTIHADSVPSAMASLLSHCRNDTTALDNLAGGLRAVVVQSLDKVGNVLQPTITESLYVTRANQAAVIAAVTAGNSAGLRDCVERQAAELQSRFLNGPKPK